MRTRRLLALPLVALALLAITLLAVAVLAGGRAFAETDNPVLSRPVPTPNGFVFSINDLDPAALYTVTTSDGQGAIDADVVTVTGLLDGESATATVTVSAPGAAPVTASVTSAALPRCPLPGTSAVTSTADGFTFAITNYQLATSYQAAFDDSAPDGVTARISGNGTVVVTGLAPGATATVAISATSIGCIGADRDVTGTATAGSARSAGGSDPGAAGSAGSAGTGSAVAGLRASARIGDVITGPSALLFVAGPQPAAAPAQSSLAPAWWLVVALVLSPVGPLLVSLPRRPARPAGSSRSSRSPPRHALHR